MTNKRRWATWLAMLAILLYGIGPVLAAGRVARESRGACASQPAACCCRPAERTTGKCCCRAEGDGKAGAPCQVRRGPCRPQAPIASPSGTVYAPIAVLTQGSGFEPRAAVDTRVIRTGDAARTLAASLPDPPPQASASL